MSNERAVRLATIEECARIAEPKNPRPCDCESGHCYCHNQGDAMSVASWDADMAVANAIRNLASQPSPAATVETDDITESLNARQADINESMARPNSSAGNGDAGCGAAVITPWADQYNACWDRSKPDALKLAALKALNYIENTEDELGMKLSCGDALREALK